MIQQHNRYSLWLRPAQSQIDELTKIISKLAHGYCTKPFPPHITLLFGFDSKLQTMRDECKKISEAQTSFTVNLQSIEYTEKYYMNLFILAEKNEYLLRLHNKLKEKFKPDHNEKYIPHVSLLYGKLDKSKQQELQLLLADSFPKTIYCERIDIYNCIGNESQWFLEKSFKLK